MKKGGLQKQLSFIFEYPYRYITEIVYSFAGKFQ